MQAIAAPLRAIFVALCLVLSVALPAGAQEDPYFEVDFLNPGLPDVPAGIDRDTRVAVRR